MDPIIVRNLKKTYRWKGRVTEALRGVSFSVKKGEIFGLLGPNGAGKSTTTHILSGVLTKDAGDVRILGGAVSESAVRERMNVASAYFGMLDLLTVEENLRVAARLYRVQRPEDRIFELLQRFKIAHLAKAPFRSLSSGERTRVLLCKGLINIPEVLLLDECTVGLDPDIAELTRSIIADYQREHRTTILFTSHYMQEVEQLCNRIAFLSEGKIILIDTAKALKKRINTQVVEIELQRPAELRKFFTERGITVLAVRGNRYTLELSTTGENLYKSLNRLFQQGHKIRDLQIHPPTLEQVFIKIARGELQ
ncbi:MAG TPA: ABC transporter ATP-binding protein [Candidatus Nanoarchaeia archaeon]|nr:ABC transporter ATP-binding protein [Candidatus Nanoarchaeia archaeon]